MSLNAKKSEQAETVCLVVLEKVQPLSNLLKGMSKTTPLASNNFTLFPNNQERIASRNICLEAIETLIRETKEMLKNIRAQKDQTQDVTQATVSPSKAGG